MKSEAALSCPAPGAAPRAGARAAAIMAVAAASLGALDAHADAAANMNLGYEFLQETGAEPRAPATEPVQRDSAPTPAGTTEHLSVGSGRADVPPVADAPPGARSTGYSGATGMAGTTEAAIPDDFPFGSEVPSGGSATVPDAQGAKAGQTRLVRAEQLYRSGEYGEALPLFRAIVNAEPRNAHAWLRIGNLMHRKRDWFDALAAYRRAARAPADRAIREKAVYNIALLNLELARQSLRRLERMRAEAATAGPDPRETGGVGDRAVRQLSDRIGAAYGDLSASNRPDLEVAAANERRSPARAPHPRPGPRTPRPRVGEKPVQVEIRQGGVSR